MIKSIYIPSLKVIDRKVNCVYPNVHTRRRVFEKALPHKEIIASAVYNITNAKEDIDKATNGILPCSLSFSLECIAEGDFLGDRLDWLKEHAIMDYGRDFFILTNRDGGTFLSMIADGNYGTDDSLRHKAMAQVDEMDDDTLREYVVASHEGTTHRWVEVEPNGDVHETEEADNNTSHYIDYPDKEVETVYNICSASCGCNCDICSMYDNYESMDKEEFIEQYSEDDWEYCETYTREEAIMDFERDNSGLSEWDIREQMYAAIEKIEYGYFDDEEMNY